MAPLENLSPETALRRNALSQAAFRERSENSPDSPADDGQGLGRAIGHAGVPDEQ
jgi:hypothetical protein